MNKCADCQCPPECNCACCTGNKVLGGNYPYVEMTAVSVNGHLIPITPVKL